MGAFLNVGNSFMPRIRESEVTRILEACRPGEVLTAAQIATRIQMPLKRCMYHLTHMVETKRIDARTNPFTQKANVYQRKA